MLNTMAKVNDHTANTASMSKADGDVTETDFARATVNGEGWSENATDDELPDIAMTEGEGSGPSVNLETNGSDDDPSDHPDPTLSLGQDSDENSLQSRKTNQADTSPLAAGGAASVNGVGEHSDHLTLPTDPEDQRKSPRKVNKKPVQAAAQAGKGPDSGKVSEPAKKKKGEGLKESKSPRKRAGSEASDRGGKVKKADRTPAAEQNKDSPRKKNKEAKQNKVSPREKNKESKGKADKTSAAEQKEVSPREKNKEPEGKTDKFPASEQKEVSPSEKSQDQEITVESNQEDKTASEPNTFKTIDRLEERADADERAIYKSPDFMRFELLVQRILIEEERRAHDRYSQVLNEIRRRLMSCVPDAGGDSGRLGSRIMRFFFRHQEQGQGDTAV